MAAPQNPLAYKYQFFDNHPQFYVTCRIENVNGNCRLHCGSDGFSSWRLRVGDVSLPTNGLPPFFLEKCPGDDEDEMYAGEYFPRRFPSGHMSLEYLTTYRSDAGEKTIALLTGIFETARAANSALAVLKTAKKNAFQYSSLVYTGCMH